MYITHRRAGNARSVDELLDIPGGLEVPDAGEKEDIAQRLGDARLIQLTLDLQTVGPPFFEHGEGHQGIELHTRDDPLGRLKVLGDKGFFSLLVPEDGIFLQERIVLYRVFDLPLDDLGVSEDTAAMLFEDDVEGEGRLDPALDRLHEIGRERAVKVKYTYTLFWYLVTTTPLMTAS